MEDYDLVLFGSPALGVLSILFLTLGYYFPSEFVVGLGWIFAALAIIVPILTVLSKLEELLLLFQR